MGGRSLMRSQLAQAWPESEKAQRAFAASSADPDSQTTTKSSPKTTKRTSTVGRVRSQNGATVTHLKITPSEPPPVSATTLPHFREKSSTSRPYAASTSPEVME
jgi:hypothetical protein